MAIKKNKNKLVKKKMKRLVFFGILLCFVVGTYGLNEPFRSFNVTQCRTGTADLNIVIVGSGGSDGLDLPSDVLGLPGPTFASDPENKRYAFHNGQSFQYTLANGTYTVSLDPITLQQTYCFYDSHYTFDNEVFTHTNLINIGKLGVTTTYYGRAKDVGSCEAYTAFTIKTGRLGEIHQIIFSQGYPTPISDPSEPITATGILTYKDSCATEGPEFEALFQLPPSCWEPVLPSWCDTFKFQ